MNIIDKFDGKYRFLSNFYYSPITLNDITYPTVEHAFQAYKTLNINKRKQISKLRTPGEAKRAGRRVKLREDWEERKITIMYNFVKKKFSNHPHLRGMLLATGDALLIESNWWHDNFWGNCYCDKCRDNLGKNNLGKILMQIRDELKH